MQPQSHAQKWLVSLYRRILRRCRAHVRLYSRSARKLTHGLFRFHVEDLHPRFLASVTPSGGEFLLNQTTADVQLGVATVVDPAGTVTAVWQSGHADGSGFGIFGRQFDSSGTPIGPEFQINQTIAGDQTSASIARSADGDFVVVWTSTQSGHPQLYGRKFNATGAPIGNEFAINSSATTTPSAPVVAIDANGDFVVAWEANGAADSDGIYYRHFDQNQQPRAIEQLVNTAKAGSQSQPAIAMDGAGNFIVGWTDFGASFSKVKGQRFLETDQPAGGEFRIGTSGSSREEKTSIGIDAVGNFAIAWQSRLPNGTSWDVDARRYSAAGSALDASPILVNTTITGAQNDASLAMREDGKFLVSFTTGLDEDGLGNGVYAQAFNANGKKDGSEFRVNTTTRNNQKQSNATWNGNFVAIAWEGNGVGDSSGVFAKRFSATGGSSNHAPVVSVPGAQTLAEDAPLTFSSANGNAITLQDSDGGGSPERVTLTATHGTITLSQTTGLTFSAGASGSSSMTFKGTLAAMNAALEGAIYTPTADYFGGATFTVKLNDLAQSGAGGALSDTETIALNITPVADAPTATSSGAELNYTENDAPSRIVSSLHLADADRDQFVGATVHLSGNVAGEDILGFANQNGIAGNWDPATATLTLSGGSSIANYQAALRSVTYVNTSEDPSEAVRMAEIVVNDGAQVSAPVVIAIHVTAVDDAPILSLPASQTTPEDSVLVFSTETGNAIVVTDADYRGAYETLRLVPSHGTLSLATTDNLTLTRSNAYSDTTIVMTGTLADLNAALDGLRFTPDPDADGAESVQIASMWTGSNHFTVEGTFALGITPVADAPVVVDAQTAPGVQTSSGLDIRANPADAESLTWFKITNITGGTLFHHDGITPVTDGDFIDATEGVNGLKFTPAEGVVAGSFEVQASTLAADAGLGGQKVLARINVELPPPIEVGDSPVQTPTRGHANAPGSGRNAGSKDRGAHDASTSQATPSAAANPISSASDQARSDAFFEPAPDPTLVSAAAARPAALQDAQGPTNDSKDDRTETRVRGVLLTSAAPISGNEHDLMGGSRSHLSRTPTVIAGSSPMWVALDRMHDAMTSAKDLRVMSGTATFVSVGMSVAYFFWVVRAGSMLSSLVSSIPAWKSVDPLPVLDQMGGKFDDDDGDGLETLLGNGRKRVRSTVFNAAGISET